MATPENAKALIQSMFFDYRKYDMGPVARYKLNKRFNLKTPNKKENHTFTNKVTSSLANKPLVKEGIEKVKEEEYA